MGSERLGGWPESTQHTAGSDPEVKSPALSQDLPLTHSAMPEGSLEKAGPWSWALRLLGLGRTQGC